MTQKALSILTLSCVAIGLFSAIAMAQAAIERMTKEDLKARLDDPNMVVVDVRTERDWSASELKIKDAVRLDIRDVTTVAADADKARTYVFYCA